MHVDIHACVNSTLVEVRGHLTGIVPSFYHMDFRDQAQVTNLGSKDFFLVIHLGDPPPHFEFLFLLHSNIIELRTGTSALLLKMN